ncbi:hypothetical protein [Bacillus sp. V3B]|nr:hypothetical protein [Bacillus sp. V3B]
MTKINKALQKQILERMIKITPYMNRLCELYDHEGYWHKWD